jgi:CheY-like chemotaxis protein
VRVRLAEEDGAVCIEVADTGAGIPAEFLPHVFDRFRQADSSSARRHGGLGLGLAIVRSVVELHGGAVTAASAGEGQGATFCIRLPRAHLDDDVARASAATLNEAAPGALLGLTVLVVEDDPDTRAFLSMLLGSAGANVLPAGSAVEAMASLDAVQPGIVLADIGMPDEDGITLIKRIRARGRERGGDVPAVALTAYAGREDRERALAAGFAAHLSKPVAADELIATLARLALRHTS